MENVSGIGTGLALLGIAEMEHFRYLFGVLALIVYLFIILLSLMILFVILTEDSLQEAMYILIGNLIFNGIFGSASFFPKLIFDLFTSSKVISRGGCLIQVFCVTLFIFFEIATYTVMAYDRYLAVCHPLQYISVMTKEKTLKLILGSLVFCVTSVAIAVLLSARLPLCGRQIKSIFCDNMSILILSCEDVSVNNLYCSTVTILFLTFTILIIAYSYVRIFLICLRVSRNLRSKAIHTLVTHLLSFSLGLIGVFFVFLRYRLGKNNLPLVLHIIFSVTFVLFPPLLNPVIYGLRTKALKLKIISNLQKMNPWPKIPNSK
ncbi:olfactory receptor 52E8-like [Pelodytes ibericus]